MAITGAIFDLDGTVLNTLPIVIEAFRMAFTRFTDRFYTDEEITNLFGPSEAGVIQRVIPHQWQDGLEVYLSEYELLFTTRNIEPFPGIEDVLRRLKDRNVLTAIVTGKGATSTAFSLNHTGLDGYFDLVQTGLPDGAFKPEHIQKVLSQWTIGPSEAFYLGDSPSDIQDARTAGVIPLAAAWAEYSDRDQLEARKPEAIFTTPQELAEWLATN
jgi:phosphoglycolate phosphatase-like HAD superfamily hydrolase